ncbi:hypothetical protein BKM21_17400 [Pseudomonas syringae pv. syringae]|nr:hypothetical protein BKM21_17400 [Pseudomonas syringae pv. syringae]
MALLSTTAVSKNISPDIADPERDKNLLLGSNSFLATANQLVSFSTNHVAVDVGVLRFLRCAFEGSYCHSHERSALTRLHFTNAVEIANADGVQVEVFGFVGRIAHDVSPVLSVQSGDTLRPGGRYSPHGW